MANILDPSFRYRSSVDTNLKRTFARERRRLKLLAKPPIVVPVLKQQDKMRSVK